MSCDINKVGSIFIYVCFVIFFCKMKLLLVVCAWKMTDVLGWREKKPAKNTNKLMTYSWERVTWCSGPHLESLLNAC